jgi:hypothetical protein
MPARNASPRLIFTGVIDLFLTSVGKLYHSQKGRANPAGKEWPAGRLGGWKKWKKDE